MKRSASILGLLFAITLGVASSALAQPADQGESPGESRATEFRAMEGPNKESVPGGPLLVIAYGVVWAAVFGYVLRIGKQMTRAEADIARLEKSLGAAAGGASARAND